MTPEERFERIETNLAAMVERQVAQDLQIEQNTNGIRDLIVLSGAALTSIRECNASIEKWHAAQAAMMEEARELQKATDEKLNILIDQVDRIIRHRNGKSE